MATKNICTIYCQQKEDWGKPTAEQGRESADQGHREALDI